MLVGKALDIADSSPNVSKLWCIYDRHTNANKLLRKDYVGGMGGGGWGVCVHV